MAWKPLPADIPLDHEALQPPTDQVDTHPTTDTAPTGNFKSLPDDAPLDQQADDQSQEPPIIISAIRPRAPKAHLKSQEVDPSYTEQGFSNEITPDAHYHTSLSDADKKEYAGFFKDTAHPPSATALQLWYHQKTGAMLANAQQIVDVFKKTGKFQTQEQIHIPTKKQSWEAAGINHTANGLGFDWGPEIAAVPDALGLGGSDRPNVWNSDAGFGNLVANNADMERAQLDQDTRDHPWASTAGELTGVAATTPLTGAVGDLAGMEKLAASQGEFNRALIQGGAEGTAYGSGAAGPGHRLEGGTTGLAMVPAVSALAKVPIAAAGAVKTVLEGSPGMARRIIAKAIQADENTPGSVGTAISNAHANDVPMALADTGENARGLLAAASRSSGVARTVARDALDERQNQLADRVVGHIERDLGPVSNPHQVADNLMTKARTEAAPLYEKAYAKPGVQQFVDKVQPLLSRPSMRKALSNAYRIAQEDGVDPETLGMSKFKPSDSPILDASGKPMQVDEVQLTKVPSWQTLDYVKRGLDDVIEGYRDPTSGKLNLDTEGRAINNTKNSFLKTFDAANPDYAAARAAYAGPVKGIAAMNTGRKFISMTADDIEARMRDMSPFEKQMAAAGARRQMAEVVSSRGDTADVVHALVGTGKKRAMLARLFGDRQGFQRFADTLAQEREGFRSFKQARLGSPTAPNLADDATLALAAGAAEAAIGGLNPLAAVRYALKFGVGKVGEKAKQQVAALLSNTDPAAIRELAAELRTKADQRGIRVRRLNNVTRAIGKGSVAAIGQQQAQ